MTCEGQEPSNYYVLFLHCNVPSIIEMYFIKDSYLDGMEMENSFKEYFLRINFKIIFNVKPKVF